MEVSGVSEIEAAEGIGLLLIVDEDVLVKILDSFQSHSKITLQMHLLNEYVLNRLFQV